MAYTKEIKTKKQHRITYKQCYNPANCGNNANTYRFIRI
jgi:hypothetical protein